MLRSILHATCDRITISESLDFVAQVPMFLKAVYIDEWKFQVKPERLKNMEEFAAKVKSNQAKFGESDFDWNQSTEELIEKTFNFISSKYLSDGGLSHIKAQMPKELEHII